MLTRNREKRIAVIGAPLLGPVRNLFNEALVRYAGEHGNWRFVVSMEDAIPGTFRLLEQLGCDGALARITSRKMADEARRCSFPVVNFSSWLCDPGLPTVVWDDAAHARLCAEHLLAKGFRRFGCVAVPGGWYIQRRIDAFLGAIRASMADAEVRVHEVLSFPMRGRDRQRFKRWIATLRPPVALMLADDPGASELMEACREMKLKIPQDIAVVAAHGHAGFIAACNPPLSHAEPDSMTIATQAARLLDALMAGEHRMRARIVVPPKGLVPLGSTDVVALDDREVAQAVEFIRAKAITPISVIDILKQTSISRTTLERRFRRSMKMSIHGYLVEKRIERAKELLRMEPPLPIHLIAKQCGISGRKRFNQVFKQKVGRRPKEWRQAPFIR